MALARPSPRCQAGLLRVSFSVDAVGPCTETRAWAPLQAWRPHTAPWWEGVGSRLPGCTRTFQRLQRPPHPTCSGNRFFNQPREGASATRPHRAGVRPDLAGPTVRGALGTPPTRLPPPGKQAVPAPIPPKCSHLFVCLGGFRKRHAGLSGYWYCLLTH